MEEDGSGLPPLKGRKAWALLAYLLRRKTPATREELAAMLFADADDPLRALRWNLVQIRRALGGMPIANGPLITLNLAPGTFVDVDVISSATWVEAIDVPGLGRDFLLGIDVSGAPSFETWLLN